MDFDVTANLLQWQTILQWITVYVISQVSADYFFIMKQQDN